MATQVMKPPAPQRSNLRPSSRGVVFSPRPILTTGPRNIISLRNNIVSSSLHGSRSFHGRVTSPASSVMSSANGKLTSIEIENIIRQKVCDKAGVMKRAFQTYDTERTLTVTPGEFRRILEHHCLPLTTEQFNSLLIKVGTNPNGTINYTKFLEQFLVFSHHFSHSRVPGSPHGRAGTAGASLVVRPSSATGELGVRSAPALGPKQHTVIGTGTADAKEQNQNLHRFVFTKPPQDVGIDTLERNLQQKIAGNLRNIVKGFQLFDYNRDGLIQRHELRRVLENYCFRFTDAQFDKFWSRYDYHHVGTINYREFLRRLGVNAAAADKHLQAVEDDNAPWDAKKKRLEREKAVTDLILKKDETRTKHKSKKLRDMSFVQVEKEFRVKMRQNHDNIKRVLMAFDSSQDGFISIDELKAVIDNFVLPVSEDVFQQLMYRFEVRGTGKVSWEQFLQKFQDPQSSGNGQTIPIGNNHKVNPVREAMEVSSTPEILEKLKKHVLTNYTTLKQAFLKFDEKRKGVITRKDLRRIVESFTIKLSEENVKELFIQLDPQHTGFINYHDFLHLFEPQEKVSAHKWLFSTHRFNQNQPPAIMAWKTVEDILTEKISENWRQVADEYVALDHEGDGTISRSHLRRLMERYALPVSDEHFEKLWTCCDETSKGRIMFAQFLRNLGIDVSPGDLDGTSTRIYNESNDREESRLNDQADRIDDMERVGKRHTNIFSAGEVIKKLQDRMSQHDTDIRKSFLRFNTSGRKRITKRDFRKVLEDIGLRMHDAQFEELTKSLGFNGRGLEYSDFIHNFENAKGKGMGQELERASNHIVNPTNVKYMKASECYNLLLDRLRQNYGSVRSAFYKVDDDHDGILTMTEFRRLLDSFMFIITDETFADLLRMLGLNRRSRLSYHDFLDKFEVVDKEEGHPWLNSQHRWNKTRTATELAAEQVHEYLCTKAEQAWSDLAKAFQNFDADGNGVIRKKELRSILYRFILPMSHAEFNKLWQKYDPDNKGFISHQDFLEKLGHVFAPGDNSGLQGTSYKMVEENYHNVLAHHEHQQAKHEEIALNQIQYSRKLSAETVEKELKDRFREYYSSFDKAFRQMDKNKDGYITLADLQRVLFQLNYFLDEEQFVSLLRRLGLPTTKARLSYFDFLKAIDDGRASKYGKRRNNMGKEQLTWHQSFDHMSVEKAMEKLKEKLTTSYDSMSSAFRAFDRNHTGLVKVGDFRRVLDSFIFKLNDQQFRSVLAKCRISQPTTTNPDKMINWIVFLQDFTLIKDVKNQEWVGHLETAAPALSPRELPSNEIEERLREVVRARCWVFSRFFADADYAKINVVSKEDFRDLMNQHFMRLTEDQFDRLWAKQAVNEFNNMEYREFLKNYSTPALQSLTEKSKADVDNEVSLKSPSRPSSAKAPAIERPSSRLGTSDSITLHRGSVSPSIADTAEGRIKSLVYKHWQDIQKECKKLDPGFIGSIPADEFVGVLDRFGLYLSLEEARDLMTRFDQGSNSGLFSYRDFLRHYILTLKPQDEGLLKRRKLHASKIPIDTGHESDSFIEAMIRLRERVLQSWKELRRSFRNIDVKGDGYVTPSQFRQILRQFSINLSEDDFYHLVSFYDHAMRGRICYNEFIRAFLQ
uniref:EF-hand calcium-binding domain-containing protein 6-like n=1 Tax=Styela clava TaxID=7725 RepID=UPI00193AC225|nr:EF-hand calcium-binding domain-containing protein 6-like [Styela clava]